MFEETTLNTGHTELVAYVGAVTGIVGALTGTVALVWNVVRHYIDKQANLFVNVVVSYVGDESHEIRVEIINNGITPITIREVLLEAYFEKRQRYGVTHQMKDPASAIPTKLDIGDVIFAKTEITATEMLEFTTHGNPAVAVYHSRSRMPLLEFFDFCGS